MVEVGDEFPPDFLISDRLAEFVRAGIMTQTPAAVSTIWMHVVGQRRVGEDFKRELADLLFTTLISHFRLMRTSATQTFPLFGEKGVFQQLKPNLTEAIPLRRGDVPEFLSLLEYELAAYLRTRNALCASWGRIGLVNGALILELSAVEKIDYQRATSRTLRLHL